MYTPIYEDLELVQQSILNYKIKIEVYNFNDEIIEEINCGLVSGNTTIDAESDIRRTASLVLSPDAQYDLKVDENNIIWLNKKIKIYIGIQNNVTKEFKYFSNGIYVFMNTNATYDAVTNQISIDCSDMMSFWDGTRAGKIGSKKIEYPAYVESIFKVTGGDSWINQKDEAVFVYKCTTLTTKPYYDNDFTFTYTGTSYDVETEDKWTVVYKKEDGTNKTLTNQKASDWGIYGSGYMSSEDRTFTVHYMYKNGEPISYNYIRDAMINAVTQLGQLKKYNIDWLGEAKAQPNYMQNWDYEEYRESTNIEGLDGKKYMQCFTIPHDIEFSSDTTVLSVITELRDLYENYETFFDEDGIFYCRLKPSGDDDEIIIDSSFIDSILISEDTSLDFSEVKNVTEAWGKCFEPEWFTQTAATYSNNVYSITLAGYTDADHTDYSNGDEIAFMINDKNKKNPKLKINSLSSIPIIDENTEIGLAENILVPNTIYTFKIKKTYDTSKKTNIIKAYFQGNWEVHAMDVLTDGTVGEEVELTPYEGEVVNTNKYSKEYFQTMFNCKNVNMTQIKDSPFTVQKLGVLLNVYNNEDMSSDSLGTEGARQENYRTCRLTDNITIVTKLCPFVDVNQKVTYRRRDKNEPEEFLIKHIDHDLSNGTTTWQLMKYYRLYLSDDVNIPLENDITDEEFYDGMLNLNYKSLYFDADIFEEVWDYEGTNSLDFEVTVKDKNNILYNITVFTFDGTINNSSELQYTRWVKTTYDGYTHIIDISNIPNIKFKIRVILSKSGLYINGERISGGHINDIINIIRQNKYVTITKSISNYSTLLYCYINKESILYKSLTNQESLKKSALLYRQGFYKYNINNTETNDNIVVDTGFEPSYVITFPIDGGSVLRFNGKYTCIYNKDIDKHTYIYATEDVNNLKYISNAIRGKFRIENEEGEYSEYPPGIYSINNNGFTLCRNNSSQSYMDSYMGQHYIAISNIDSINIDEYSDKIKIGEFDTTQLYYEKPNNFYYHLNINIGFEPKIVIISQYNENNEDEIKNYNYFIISKGIHNQIYTDNMNKIERSYSNLSPLRENFSIRNNGIEITSRNNSTYNKDIRYYKYIAIG